MPADSGRNPCTIEYPISVGDEVRDVVTGFTGIVTSLTHWFNWCQRAGVQPSVDKDGKVPMVESFDVEQLEIITPNKVRAKPLAPAAPITTSGGPMPTPRQHETPRER